MLSVTVAVFVTSIFGKETIETTVGSFIVFPSVSSPSSEVSLTLFDWPGVLAVTIALLEILPVVAASLLIKNVAEYVAVSPIVSVPWEEPADADTNDGPEVRVRLNPWPSVSWSVNVTDDKTKLPVFLTEILYKIVSPRPLDPSPLSITTAVFVASIDPEGEISDRLTMVGSLDIFPSESSPSSLWSETSFVFPGLLPVAVAIFEILPESSAAWVIINVAV